MGADEVTTVEGGEPEVVLTGASVDDLQPLFIKLPDENLRRLIQSCLDPEWLGKRAVADLLRRSDGSWLVWCEPDLAAIAGLSDGG